MLDGARVIMWAWSGQEPFGYVVNEDNTERETIYGLAICKYEDNDEVYCFSCDRNWETVQDSPYNAVEEAIEHLPNQYKNVKANWQMK